MPARMPSLIPSRSSTRQADLSATNAGPLPRRDSLADFGEAVRTGRTSQLQQCKRSTENRNAYEGKRLTRIITGAVLRGEKGQGPRKSNQTSDHLQGRMRRHGFMTLTTPAPQYLWLSKVPNGPTIKFHCQNIHTMYVNPALLLPDVAMSLAHHSLHRPRRSQTPSWPGSKC